MGVHTTSVPTLKRRKDIKQKYRNLLKLRYLRFFEVSLTLVSEYFQRREDFELYLLFVLYSISFPYTMVYCNQNETISCLSSDDVQMTSFIPDHKCKGITFLNLSQTLCEINNWKNFWLHF